MKPKLMFLNEFEIALKCKDFKSVEEAKSYLIGKVKEPEYEHTNYVRFIWETITSHDEYEEQEIIGHYVEYDKGGKGASLCYIFGISF